MAESKYAVVVAVAKRARSLSEQNKNNENNRLSTMVTIALDEIGSGRLGVDTGVSHPIKEARRG